MRKVYRDPESAFAACNPRGLATITLDDLLDNTVVKRSGHDPVDVKSLLFHEKVFSSDSPEQLDFMQFKKFLFPQLMLIEHGAYEELNRKEDRVLRAFNEIGSKDTQNKKSVVSS